MGGTNNSSVDFKNSTISETRIPVFSYVLPVICLVIFLGNLLVLLAIKTFRVRRVPDLLIGSLALVELVNDVGPVLLSTIIYFINSKGFNGLNLNPLCEFYNWAATFLRLLACFITTTMSLDRLSATLWPFFYRTKITLAVTVYIVFGTSLSAAFIAAWPAMGWGEVYPHIGICSFDFGGNYAFFIAILGYVQLIIVLCCFIGVAHVLKKFRQRLDALKGGQSMVLRSGQIEVDQHQSSSLRMENPNVKDRSGSRHSRESRLFVKIMAIVVLLFYMSWIPIIFSITMELITQKQNDYLQSLSAQMAIFGSLVNPFVYCVMCAPYRRGYIYVIRKACTVCGCLKPERESNIPITAVVVPSMQGTSKRSATSLTTASTKMGSYQVGVKDFVV